MTLSRRAFDEHMMRIAVGMARRGLGTTAPNPAVGAVIADEATGEVIARGWTQPSGRPHAEKEALRRAGDRAKGMTMYVTLEPCAQTGRIPTCADAMVTSGLRRVVCAIPDPNPVVSGRGFSQLRAAGLEVDVGLLADEARWVTLGHIRRITQRRPFVQIKLALGAEGAVPAGNGAPVWITSPEARAYAHFLRAEADAILVGAGTVLADDPELTCRLPGLMHRSPDRIVIDSALKTPPKAKVYRQQGERPRVWVAAARMEGGVQPETYGHGGPAVLAIARTKAGNLDLVNLLARLAEHGITRLMVEGGPGIWRAFLMAGVVDEACVAVAPIPVAGEKIQVIEGEHADYFAGHGLVPVAYRMLGPDRLTIYRRKSP